VSGAALLDDSPGTAARVAYLFFAWCWSM
jgi:hypothetical protein